MVSPRAIAGMSFCVRLFIMCLAIVAMILILVAPGACFSRYLNGQPISREICPGQNSIFPMNADRWSNALHFQGRGENVYGQVALIVITLFLSLVTVGISCVHLAVGHNLTYTLLYYNSGLSAADAHRQLQAMYGEGIVSYRTVADRFGFSKKGDYNLEDSKRSGRPVEVDLEALRDVVEADSSMTTREMSETLGVSHATILDGLTKIGKVQKLGRWIPHDLSSADRSRRVEACASFLSLQRRRPFLRDLVTRDEKPGPEARPPPSKGDALLLVVQEGDEADLEALFASHPSELWEKGIDLLRTRWQEQLFASGLSLIAFLVCGGVETWYATGFDHMSFFIMAIGNGVVSGCAGLPGCQIQFVVKGWAVAAAFYFLAGLLYLLDMGLVFAKKDKLDDATSSILVQRGAVVQCSVLTVEYTAPLGRECSPKRILLKCTYNGEFDAQTARRRKAACSEHKNDIGDCQHSMYHCLSLAETEWKKSTLARMDAACTAQKREQVIICQNHLNRSRTTSWMSSIVAQDEKWCTYDNITR
ncbi:unnamed protein product [Nippostrongylus brasiliensis]|uniref:HTH_48 domain-containing protein n=1 Tax=Nippostrongylus brasiliensis TaxID=27835 RepID=A0A0N4YER1_NIPBR|nr:unnamed protein product [Nippostrongylus brasiliensis]